MNSKDKLVPYIGFCGCNYCNGRCGTLTVSDEDLAAVHEQLEDMLNPPEAYTLTLKAKNDLEIHDAMFDPEV